MVVNRKLLLKHKGHLEQLYKCKSRKSIDKWLRSADLIVIKIVLGIIVDVVYNKIPILKPNMKSKLRKEEGHLKLLAENYTKLKCENDKNILLTALDPVIPLFKIVLRPLFEAETDESPAHSSDTNEINTESTHHDNMENTHETVLTNEEQLILDSAALDLPDIQCSVCGNSVGSTF